MAVAWWWSRLDEKQQKAIRDKRNSRRRIKDTVDPLLKFHHRLGLLIERKREDSQLAMLNPVNEPYWTLGMALAWIAARDMRTVARMSAQQIGNHDNGPRRLAILLAMREVTWGEKNLMGSSEAWGLLAAAAKRGDLVVTAVGRNGREDIPAATWLDMASPYESYNQIPWEIGRFPPEGPQVAAHHPMIPSEVARKLWRSQEDTVDQSPPSRSGAPGRPTSKHLVEDHFRKRLSEGAAEETNSAESEVLAEWLKQTHPQEPRLTPKAIRNRLPDWRREFKGAQN